MQFTMIKTLLLSIALTGALASPTSSAPVPDLVARQFSYNCKGSSFCKGLDVASCDAARRRINPNNQYVAGAAAGNSGTCSGNCGIFVQGNKCSVSGTTMDSAYGFLRNNGCAKCGSYYLDSNCHITINYVTGC